MDDKQFDAQTKTHNLNVLLRPQENVQGVRPNRLFQNSSLLVVRNRGEEPLRAVYHSADVNAPPHSPELFTVVS